MKRKIRILALALVGVIASTAASWAVAAERIEQAPTAPAVRIAANSNGVQLTAHEATRFDIYSITGQLIRSVEVKSETLTVELPTGCYIVRCPQGSQKVVVR
jgi:hypothetical protein